MNRVGLLYKDYRKLAIEKGFKLYKKPGEITIVGYRFPDSRPDYYDDILTVYYNLDYDSPISSHYSITTYPGIPWLLKPMNKKGTAILKAGQYIDSYALGEFKGYTALKQIKPVTVYRDFNKDLVFDKSEHTLDTGYFGIHIHRGNLYSKVVGLTSAGCQVFKDRAEYSSFINICEQAKFIHNNRFTYTLVEL